MSIRAELERRVGSVLEDPIGYSAVYPDRVEVYNDDLIAALNEADLLYPGTDEMDPYFLVSAFDRAIRFLRSATWSDLQIGEVPQWVSDAAEECAWARERIRAGDSCAWAIGDKMVVKSPFTLTLSDRLHKMPSSGITFNLSMEYWVLTDPVLDDGQLRDLLNTYSITPSPKLTARMEGSERWKDILDSHVSGAREAGLKVPFIFPTDRMLKPHQEDAVLGLAHIKRGLLADQVGLGKGGEFISAFLTLVQDDQVNRNLPDSASWPLVIITNKSLLEEIAGEVNKWHKSLEVEVLYGTGQQDISPDAKVICLNVDLLKSRLPDILAVEPKGMICDEAHSLKNPEALRTQAAQALADDIVDRLGDDAFIVLASGTPFLNMPLELWSLLCILHVDHLFGEYAISKVGTHAKIRTKNGWRFVEISYGRAFEIRWCAGAYNKYNQWENSGYSETRELNQLLLEHVMIRRRKSDVMHPMPPLTEDIVRIDMDPEGAAAYWDIEEDFRRWMMDQADEYAEQYGCSRGEALRKIVGKLNAAEGIMRATALRQAVARAKIAGIKQWISNFMDGFIDHDPSTEYPGGYRETLAEDRTKLIVFAYHREIQSLLIDDPELQMYGMVSLVSGEDPQEAKRIFQTDPSVRLIICYSGAREGHTLTAASDVFLVEIPYVPSWVVQMAGRCWARLSEEFEPHSATVHYGVSPGTIDSLLLRKVRLKKAAFNAVIDGEGMDDLETGDMDHMSNEGQANLLLDLMSRGTVTVRIAG